MGITEALLWLVFCLKIYSWGMWNCLETLTWLSDADLEKLCEERDPIEAPSCHYKVQPENQGKLRSSVTARLLVF